MANSSVPAWAEHPDLVDFYSTHRRRPEELYPSEKRFLPWLAARCKSVLDTGCGTGGFSNIWRHHNPKIEYTGVELSSSLVEAARQFHPEFEFVQGNLAEGVPLSDRCAAVVQALGWLHWEPDYARAILELWRLADRYLFLDVRLVPDESTATVGRQKLAFASEWDGKTTTPYVTVAWRDFAALVMGLDPATLLGYGYWGMPAETVVGVGGQVCFAAFVLERARASDASSPATICLNLPLEWPPELAQDVRLLPPSHLEALVPRS